MASGVPTLRVAPFREFVDAVKQHYVHSAAEAQAQVAENNLLLVGPDGKTLVIQLDKVYRRYVDEAISQPEGDGLDPLSYMQRLIEKYGGVSREPLFKVTQRYTSEQLVLIQSCIR